MTIDLTSLPRLDMHQDYVGATMRANEYGDYVSFDDLVKFLHDAGFNVKSIETKNDENYWKRFWSKVEELKAKAIDA